jgi:hypothetical protein
MAIHLLIIAGATLAIGMRAQDVSRPSARDQKKTVAVTTLYAALAQRAKSLEDSESVKKDFARFLLRRNLNPDPKLFSQYARVKMLFEATRDAGLWNIHWMITNQEPTSKRIWFQWERASGPYSFTKPTAIAECDEISALFAFLARKLGVSDCGLFWPAWNHTVAVWFPRPDHGDELRVIVPTTQIFLEPGDLFDTGKFHPWDKKMLWAYKGQDVPDAFQIPEPLCRFFLGQIDKYARASEQSLQRMRYLREAVFLGRLSPAAAAQQAEHLMKQLPADATEDLQAYSCFVADMAGT